MEPLCPAGAMAALWLDSQKPSSNGIAKIQKKSSQTIVVAFLVEEYYSGSI